MKNNRYLERFLKLNTAPLLLENKLFPNLKEVTESFGAFISVLNNLKLDRNRNDIDVFIVGDGHTPKTAALFACLTKWNCHSIDPVMRIEKKYNIDRLFLYKDKIENINFNSISNTAIIVCVHSHAKISDTLKAINYKIKHLINMPCCFKSDIKKQPDIIYSDDCIHSEKNIIEIYFNCN